MRARKTRVFWFGVVAALALLLSLALVGVRAEELRGAANVADGRRLGVFPDWLQNWLQMILQRVASWLGAVPTPKLRGGSDEGDYELSDEGGSDPLPDAVDADGKSEQYSQHSDSSSSKGSEGKGKGKGSSSKSSKSSSKRKGKSKSKSSSSYSKPAPSPESAPRLVPPTAQNEFEIPTVTPREPETGSPNSGPTLTFAPFSTLAPVPAPVPAPALTFAPFSTLAPSVAPPTDVPPTPTAAPIDPSPNATALPTNAVPLTTAPAASSPPTVAPTSAAPVPMFQSVTIPTYYIAYATTAADREPTEDEYLLMNDLTTLYFVETLGNIYNNPEPAFGAISTTVFDSIESVIDSTQYNAGIPEEMYNIYMSFETEIIFSTNSTVIPSSGELFDIMLDAINPTYIVNYVWQAPDTPFISTQEVVMSAIEILDTVDSFGAGYISESRKADIEVETVSDPSDAESRQHDINSFGQGEATDRDYFSPIRERIVLPNSIIKDTIFRKDDNGTTEEPDFAKDDNGTR